MKQLALALSISALFGTAQASTTTYADFDSWADSVTGTITVDNFNAYNFSANGAFTHFGSSTQLDGITYSVTGFGQIFGVTAALDYDAPYHNTNYLEWQRGGNGNSLTLSLTGNTSSFSLKLGQLYGGQDTYQISLNNGESFSVAGSSAYKFFGLTSANPFSTIKITANGLFPTIDNVAVGAISPAPEPESYAMLLAGLGMIGTIARRRKLQNV